MRNLSLLFVVTLFFCALAGCQDDLSTEKALWEASTQGWTAKLEDIKKGHEQLSVKVKASAAAHGEAALQAEQAALDKLLETGRQAIADAEKTVATTKATMDGLMAQGSKVPVEVALGTSKTTVDGVLARAGSLVSAASSALETLTKAEAAGRPRRRRLMHGRAPLSGWPGSEEGFVLSVDGLLRVRRPTWRSQEGPRPRPCAQELRWPASSPSSSPRLLAWRFASQSPQGVPDG